MTKGYIPPTPAEQYLLDREATMHLAIFLGTKFSTAGKGFQVEINTDDGRSFSAKSRSLASAINNVVRKMKLGQQPQPTRFHIGDFEVHVP